MKKYEWLDAYFMKQPGTEKKFQPEWQADKYLVLGKMYAYIGTHDPTGRPLVTMKLEPAYSELLRGQYQDIVPGYYMNKVHWSSVFLDGGVPKDVLADMVKASHRALVMTLGKKARQELLGQA